MIHVGKLVKTTATNCGVTTKELSRRLGVSQSTVENYVKRSSLDIEILKRISDVLEVNLIDRFLHECGDTGFTVITKEHRDARAELHSVQLELEKLACENFLLKEEINRMRKGLSIITEQPLMNELNTATRTRAQTVYRWHNP